MNTQLTTPAHAQDQTQAVALADARIRLETLWGCGPGIYVMGEGYDPHTGVPMEMPVGQMCASGAHDYSYWDGTCEFAHNAATAVTSTGAIAVPEPEPTREPTPDPWATPSTPSTATTLDEPPF